MRKIALVSLLALAGLLLGAGPGQADWRHRGHVWPHSRVGVHIGIGHWWGPPWWYGPPYVPYYYPYYPPPAVVIESPPVYIERTPPPPPPAPPAYWYYCPSARQYYPTVRECPEPWVQVPPRSP